MAGHSHWANIQRRKGAVDAKKGVLFSKLAKNIMAAARLGGGDPDMNLRLKYAIDKAKSYSLPRDKIERAVKKGTGELGAASLESIIYEAIAPGGVFVLMEILTDNRNRTAPEIRKILERKDAHMGAVAWAFEQKGLITVPSDGVDPDTILEIVLEAGAEDMERVGDSFQITTAATEMETVRQALAEKDVTVESAEISQMPNNPTSVDETTARKVLELLEQLTDHDDVQNVFSSIELSDDLLAKLAKE